MYSRQFWLLCGSNFLFSASFQMIIPELPDFLANLGGKEYIGYIIALFTLTAGISRPFSGKLTDTIGRMPLMIFGSLVCFLCGGAYIFVHSVSIFLLLRLIHGFSTGTKPTATAAYVADIIPENRRGEAQGMLGIFTATGMSIGPSMGSFIVDFWGLNRLFLTSSLFALLSILLLMTMKETLLQRQKFHINLLKIKWIDVFEPHVMSIFWVMLMVSFSSGVLLTLVPDQTRLLGIKNKGIFFTVYTIASLLIRIFFAKSSDKYGRISVLKISLIFLVAAMFFLAFSSQFWHFLVASVLFGISWGFNTPTLTAWTIDLSEERYRGRAMATMYIALEIGIGLGAFVSGKIYQGRTENIPISYCLSGILGIISFINLFWVEQKSAFRSEKAL